MVKLYVLQAGEEQTAFRRGVLPKNCFARDFDTPVIAQSYLKGLRSGREGNVIRESHLEMAVVFSGSEDEKLFRFDSVAEKNAFRQGLEDGEIFMESVVYDEDSEHFQALEAMYASQMELVFIRCDEGSLGLLKSFGAKLGVYDATFGAVLADVSPHVLTQIAQFPSDFEVEFGVTVQARDDKGESGEKSRSATLVFLRNESAKVTTAGVLSLKTTLDTDAEVKIALIEATTEWVSKTEAGRRLWVNSGEDLNIGDLASSGAFSDAMFLAALQQRGVAFVDCAVGCTDDSIAYDQVLVDTSRLEAGQIPIPFVEM